MRSTRRWTGEPRLLQHVLGGLWAGANRSFAAPLPLTVTAEQLERCTGSDAAELGLPRTAGALRGRAQLQSVTPAESIFRLSAGHSSNVTAGDGRCTQPCVPLAWWGQGDCGGVQKERWGAANVGSEDGLPPPWSRPRQHGGTQAPLGHAAARPFSSALPTGGGARDAPDVVDKRRVNRAITAHVVRLVTDTGHELLARSEALERARQAGLDLVEVAGKGDVPVCKLLDYSRFRYDAQRREKELRKKQVEKRRMDEVKEIRISSRTDERDIEMKANMARKLLDRGYRVKCTVAFKASDKGSESVSGLLQTMLAHLVSTSKVEAGPREDGNRLWAILRPSSTASKQSTT